MKIINQFASGLLIVGALALGACANMNAPAGSSPAANTGAAQDRVYPGYGVVHSVEVIKNENTGIGGSGIGLGTIAGAVIGGVAGNQVGQGKGNTAATVVGAAGGAYVGNQMENRQRAADTYRVTVRMQNGGYQSITQTNNTVRVGDRVMVAGDGSVNRY